MRVRITAMILLLALLLSACGNKGKTEMHNPFEGRLVAYRVDLYSCVLVDVETGVCYLVDYRSRGESIHVLLNADGTIATWEGE